MIVEFLTSPLVGRSKREVFRVGACSIRSLCPPPDVLPRNKSGVRASTSPQRGR